MPQPVNVLAVDDDPNMHRLIKLYLNRENFSVTTVSSGRMALHKLDTEEFDLVISDIQMPQMDGIALVEEIRNRNNDVPVIVISAFGTNFQANKALEAGANMVIEKPFEQEQLITIIEQQMNGKQY